MTTQSLAGEVLNAAEDITDVLFNTKLLLVLAVLQLQRVISVLKPAGEDLSLLCEYFKLRPRRRQTAPVVVEGNGQDSGPVDSRS